MSVIINQLKSLKPGNIIRLTQNKTEDLSVTSNYISDAETFTDLTKEYVGTIVSFNNVDGNGIIENKIGTKYRFESKNICLDLRSVNTFCFQNGKRVFRQSVIIWISTS